MLPDQYNVVVLDSQGNDVTPRSLLDAPGDGESRAALIDPSASVADLPLASISGGKHTDPVWGLRWVAEGKGLGEALVSISTDGRVTQWNVQKGLEHTDLMVLRRVARQGEAVRGTISRRAAGLCLDFHAADNLLYVAGTEDGHVLAHYFGHSGPVYRVRWSPFGAGAFLSCSADWTIKLWDAEKAAALFTFQARDPSAEPVSDVAWSPSSATIFASATGDGRLDIWDLAQSTISPIHTDQLDGTRLSCVSFAPSSPVLVAGGDNGVVGVYALTGYLAEPSDCTAAQQLAALEKVTGADAGR
ncbi:hypothetical protein EMIHUDRAFT_115368 [Emiliania huxleyi CCMP1516]|uniref:Dynein axonemal intermediate chain 4 n=2 Tax=Emiliania huxleyi TaxID=2903 RepID=A0A0D3JQ49_EMIH1|nr:hypothetical protein EMIHUDRAFT_115368 [Emiliania huxleyi CCMP1516]EOD25634.1 hypothetical protein EMIHUDRAFT_115368 [Emiliania huxleyi CCMP1516]|eukprot:XP_005778063.1 hypothetical protein EMIHUDRAFT_115368 [Emiliania huxleyi CCMP1516]